MDDSDNPNDSSRSATPFSSHESSRRPSSSSSTTSSMSDLTQFMTRSTLTCRRTSLESRLSSLPPLSNTRSRHGSRRRHSSRGPTSSNANSHRGGVSLSRMDSLISSLTDSDSDTYRLSSMSSASAATSPSPTLSPTELTTSPVSYFTSRHHQPHTTTSVTNSEAMGSRQEYQQPPNTIGIPRSSISRVGSNRNGLEAVPEARKVEKVMKPIKMRRRHKERKKA